MFYSQSTKGFYSKEINGNNIPSDAIEITNEQYQALVQGVSEGKIIGVDENGNVVLQDMPSPSVEQIHANMSKQRQMAYASEADCLFFKAQRGEATMEEWQAKVQEIKQRFPYPA